MKTVNRFHAGFVTIIKHEHHDNVYPMFSFRKN